MKENQASQLIAHIEEAEDWLHKARAEFHQSNPIRGELILNLAQAEVKHAWELSRRQFVLRTSGKENRNSTLIYLFPAAAAIVLVLGLIFGTQLVRIMTNTSAAKEQVKKPIRIATKINGSQIPKDLVPKSLAVVTTEPEIVVKTKTTDKISNQSTNNAPNTTNAPVIADNPSDTRIIENKSGQTRLQPVSQIAIDEEALAKEASRSLRNEK